MGFPLEKRLPTVLLGGKWDDLAGKAQGSAIVNSRLTNATFNPVALERTTGGSQIGPNDYSIGMTGDFDGAVLVSMTANTIPQPAAPLPPVLFGYDVYVGPVLGKFGTDPFFKPLAWIAVVAER